jgi:hypothetical protein
MALGRTVDHQRRLTGEWQPRSRPAQGVDRRLRAPQRLDQAILGYQRRHDFGDRVRERRRHALQQLEGESARIRPVDNLAAQLRALELGASGFQVWPEPFGPAQRQWGTPTGGVE